MTGRPVRGVYSRPESMRATTKRHPASIAATFGADADGRLTGVRFDGDFDTGAYASWGPTVANRVPVHATGPYAVDAARCTTRGDPHERAPPGAFRGFGVPQAAIAHEALIDDLAGRSASTGSRSGAGTRSGRARSPRPASVLDASAGLPACLDALAPRLGIAARGRRGGQRARPQTAGSPVRRGVGIGAMWYGIGNTSLPNPSTVDMGIGPDGTVRLFSGAMDIGQGSATVVPQIAADALGVGVASLWRSAPDTDLTPDAGKTSASRQTFVSGNAARLAGEALRRRILELAEAPDDAVIEVPEPGRGDGRLRVRDGSSVSVIELRELPVGAARLRPPGDGHVRPEDDASSTTAGRASRTRPTGSGRRSRSSTWTRSSGPSSSAGSSRPTTSGGRSTRRSSRDRSRAGSPRASAWRSWRSTCPGGRTTSTTT